MGRPLSVSALHVRQSTAAKVELGRLLYFAFLHALTDTSAVPAIPAEVPSGLPTVDPLPNQSPVLDGRNTLSDAVIGAGSHLTIEGFDVKDYTADGLMINLGTHLVFRDLYVENSGLYGIYPVEVVGVRIEDCTVTGARDAGIYVGQAKDAVVRGNTAYGNVTGIEIENTLSAVVEDNEVYDNAGGLLVFLLPNNPSKISREALVRNNHVHDNNHENFGDPTAIVSRVPSGTGVLVLAGDDVTITGNTITGNRSVGVGVIGLDALFGPGATFDVDPAPDHVRVFSNALTGNGTQPAPAVTEAGFDGADLVWDLSGTGHAWNQPGATRLPYVLPRADWSIVRYRANQRFWQIASALQ